jgi:hypothetical protein
MQKADRAHLRLQYAVNAAKVEQDIRGLFGCSVSGVRSLEILVDLFLA